VAYRQREFLRIGYYVHIMPDGVLSEERRNSVPTEELVKHLTRTILIDKPRITKFDIGLSSEAKQPSKKDIAAITPSKGERAEGSNSLFSISKTSCNDK
jgi:hypothetical protein